jgi:hypothetical protein
LWILATLWRLAVELESRGAWSLVAIIARGSGNHTFISFLWLYIYTCWVSTSRVVVFGTKRLVVVLHPMIILMREQANRSKSESGEIGKREKKGRTNVDLSRLMTSFG